MSRNNSIHAIKPYQWNGLWVFDDPAVGLHREAFVSGADTIIDWLVFNQEITNADQGFVLLFSETEFPSHQIRLDRVNKVGSGVSGNTYRHEYSGLEGWLCPALYCYFTEAPKRIYAAAKAAA